MGQPLPGKRAVKSYSEHRLGKYYYYEKEFLLLLLFSANPDLRNGNLV
jgi:hypothetical protein